MSDPVIIDMRGLTAEQQDAALVLAQRNRALDRVAFLEKQVAELEAQLEELRGRKLGNADAWAGMADEATGMYHHMRDLHEAMKKAIRALLDTETPAGELRKAIGELVR